MGNEHLDAAQHSLKGSHVQTQQSRNETDKIGKEHEMMSQSQDHRVVYVAGSTSRHRSIKCGLDAIERLLQDGSGRKNNAVVSVFTTYAYI